MSKLREIVRETINNALLKIKGSKIVKKAKVSTEEFLGRIGKPINTDEASFIGREAGDNNAVTKKATVNRLEGKYIMPDISDILTYGIGESVLKENLSDKLDSAVDKAIEERIQDNGELFSSVVEKLIKKSAQNGAFFLPKGDAQDLDGSFTEWKNEFVETELALFYPKDNKVTAEIKAKVKGLLDAEYEGNAVLREFVEEIKRGKKKDLELAITNRNRAKGDLEKVGKSLREAKSEVLVAADKKYEEIKNGKSDEATYIASKINLKEAEMLAEKYAGKENDVNAKKSIEEQLLKSLVPSNPIFASINGLANSLKVEDYEEGEIDKSFSSAINKVIEKARELQDSINYQKENATQEAQNKADVINKQYIRTEKDYKDLVRKANKAQDAQEKIEKESDFEIYVSYNNSKKPLSISQPAGEVKKVLDSLKAGYISRTKEEEKRIKNIKNDSKAKISDKNSKNDIELLYNNLAAEYCKQVISISVEPISKAKQKKSFIKQAELIAKGADKLFQNPMDALSTLSIFEKSTNSRINDYKGETEVVSNAISNIAYYNDVLKNSLKDLKPEYSADEIAKILISGGRELDELEKGNAGIVNALSLISKNNNVLETASAVIYAKAAHTVNVRISQALKVSEMKKMSLPTKDEKTQLQEIILTSLMSNQETRISNEFKTNEKFAYKLSQLKEKFPRIVTSSGESIVNINENGSIEIDGKVVENVSEISKIYTDKLKPKNAYDEKSGAKFSIQKKEKISEPREEFKEIPNIIREISDLVEESVQDRYEVELKEKRDAYSVREIASAKVAHTLIMKKVMTFALEEKLESVLGSKEISVSYYDEENGKKIEKIDKLDISKLNTYSARQLDLMKEALENKAKEAKSIIKKDGSGSVYGLEVTQRKENMELLKETSVLVGDCADARRVLDNALSKASPKALSMIIGTNKTAGEKKFLTKQQKAEEKVARKNLLKIVEINPTDIKAFVINTQAANRAFDLALESLSRDEEVISLRDNKIGKDNTDETNEKPSQQNTSEGEVSDEVLNNSGIEANKKPEEAVADTVKPTEKKKFFDKIADKFKKKGAHELEESTDKDKKKGKREHKGLNLNLSKYGKATDAAKEFVKAKEALQAAIYRQGVENKLASAGLNGIKKEDIKSFVVQGASNTSLAEMRKGDKDKLKADAGLVEDVALSLMAESVSQLAHETEKQVDKLNNSKGVLNKAKKMGMLDATLKEIKDAESYLGKCFRNPETEGKNLDEAEQEDIKNARTELMTKIVTEPNSGVSKIFGGTVSFDKEKGELKLSDDILTAATQTIDKAEISDKFNGFTPGENRTEGARNVLREESEVVTNMITIHNQQLKDILEKKSISGTGSIRFGNSLRR